MCIRDSATSAPQSQRPPAPAQPQQQPSVQSAPAADPCPGWAGDEHEPMYAPPRYDETSETPAVESASRPGSGGDQSAAPAAAVAESPSETPGESAGQGSGGRTLGLVDVRRLWPDIVAATMGMRRVTWMTLRDHAQVIDVDATTLTVGINNPGAFSSFTAGGSEEILRQAAIDVAGVDWRVTAILDPGARAGADQPVVTSPAVASGVDQQVVSSVASSTPSSPSSSDSAPAEASAPTQRPQPPTPTQPVGPDEGVNAAREALERSRTEGAQQGTPVDHRALADEAADPDDPAADTQGLDSTQLLQQALGAQVVDEIEHT